MRCSRCGAEINKMNYHYIPDGKKKNGKKYCLKCMRKEGIVTLV